MEDYLNGIIEILKELYPQSRDIHISANTKFYEISGMDSMSIIDFQIALAEKFGKKCNDVQPMMEMSIGEFADLLSSL